MILSDMKYLRIRRNLRSILRENRDRIPTLIKLTSEIGGTSEEKAQELTKNYLKQFDYNRAKEFTKEIREARLESFHIMGFSVIPNKYLTLIEQADYYASAMTKKTGEKK